MAIGSNTGKAMVRKGIGRAAYFERGLLGKIAAIKHQQPLPMPLGGVAVVDRPLWKRKTVMGAGIDLNLGVSALHRCRDFVDDLLRRVDIGFGAAEVKLGPGLACGQMRAVGLVGR